MVVLGITTSGAQIHWPRYYCTPYLQLVYSCQPRSMYCILHLLLYTLEGMV